MYMRCVSAVCGLSLAVLFVFLFVAGCDSDSDNNTSIPQQLSINFTNYLADDQPTWVILHNLQGDSALSVKRASPSGKVSFYDLDTNRVSFTVVHGGGSESYSYFYSYMNVPGGTWTIPSPHHMTYNEHFRDPLGGAAVTLNYPEGEYDVAYYGTPGFGHYWIYRDGNPMASVKSDTIPVISLDDNNTMSIYAFVKNATSYYCGWLLNQPFQMQQLNAYSVNLDQPHQTKTVACSRPITYAGLYALHGQQGFSYSLDYQSFDEEHTSAVELAVSAFPAQKYRLSVENQLAEMPWQYECIVNSIPSSLMIPRSSIDASYNVNTHAFENISFEGEADLLELDWSDFMGGYWSVYTDVSTLSRSLPVVPDSIINLVGDNLSLFYGDRIYLCDRDNTQSFDQYLSQEYQSSSPWWQKWNTDYSIRKNMIQPILKKSEEQQHPGEREAWVTISDER
jgi:hypothetical protein